MGCATAGKSWAFTLVEILIVIVILAILAAIIVPRFANASDEAKEAALVFSIRIIRKQINLYTLQHGGQGPHLDDRGQVGFPDPTRRMTERTDARGRLDPAGSYGPYLDSWPANPFSASNVATSVAPGNGAKPPRSGMSGWYYDLDSYLVSANSITGGESMDPE